MKLSVPFIPDKPYTGFLKNQGMNLESIYFAVHSGPLLDSRMRFEETGLNELSKDLQPFKDIKKYCLLNSRFIHPDAYQDNLFLNQTMDRLELLYVETGMTGFVFADAYFLNALSRTNRDVIHSLEAVPGINCMMDSSQKVFAFFDLIGDAGFKLPTKIVLDRSLNRNFLWLEKTITEIKDRYPSVKIELLANEGCIDCCPFKLTHDGQISLSNLGLSREKNFAINQTLGCHAFFHKHPEQFFKSPFIRPEDLDAYQGLADTIKLCGRTLGVKFLINCITAYAQTSYDGNLLDLMDATHWLSDLIHMDNKKLDPGFLSMITSCSKDCRNCKICRDLLLKTSTNKPLKIKAYKDCL